MGGLICVGEASMSGPFLLLAAPSWPQKPESWIIFGAPFPIWVAFLDRAPISPTGVPVSAEPGCVCREAAVVVGLQDAVVSCGLAKGVLTVESHPMPAWKLGPWTLPVGQSKEHSTASHLSQALAFGTVQSGRGLPFHPAYSSNFRSPKYPRYGAGGFQRL